MSALHRVNDTNSEGTLPSAHRPRVIELALDWADENAIYQALKELELFGKEYGYAGIHVDEIAHVLTHGTHTRGDEAEIVYCCVLTDLPYNKFTIRQDGGAQGSLWNYMTDNSENDQMAVTVYDRSKLIDRESGMYEFTDPTNKTEAIVAIIKFTF